MHELGMCRSILRVVEAEAEGAEVRVVHVRVGELKAVVPETMQMCWGMATEGTAYAGTSLELEHVPATLSCADCGAVSPLDLAAVECGSCGGRSVSVLTGEELDVVSLELRDEAEDGLPPRAASDDPAGPAL